MAKKYKVTPFYIKECLDVFKSFEPNGIGATDFKDILLIQSKNNLTLFNIIYNYYKEICDMNFEKISKKLDISFEDLNNILSPMREYLSYPRKNFSKITYTYDNSDIVIKNDLSFSLDPSYSKRFELEFFHKKDYQKILDINFALKRREDTLKEICTLLIEKQNVFLKKID